MWSGALEEAHKEFERIPLHGYAAATSHVAGTLLGDEKGLVQVRSAEDFFRRHNYKNPAAFLRMLIPGQWA
jgi:hypothetical protein